MVTIASPATRNTPLRVIFTADSFPYPLCKTGWRFSLTLRLSTAFFPTRPAQRTSGHYSCHFSVLKFQLAIHKYILHARRQLRRLCVSRSVENRGGIENRDIRKKTFLEQPAISQPFALRGKGSHFSDSLLEGQQV